MFKRPGGGAGIPARDSRESRRGTVGTSKRLPLLLVLALTLPFLFQPFHIDDRIYLEVAENALRSPLYPYDYPPVFEGIVTPDAASHSHLPLTAYYLAVVVWAAGGEVEWVCHLAFLVFPLLAVWAFADLAGRFTKFPAAAACLLMVGPGVLVLSHTLMTEVPLLAFWILAVSRFLVLAEGQGTRTDWWLAGLGLLGAAMISLLSLGLILLLAAYLAVHWRRLGASRRHLLVLLLLPLLLWVIWYTRGYLHYDRFLLIRTVLHMDKREAFSGALVGAKALSMLLNLGGAFLSPLAVWYGFGRYRSLWLLPLLAAAPMAAPWLAPEGWTGVQSFLWALFAAAGVLTVSGLARRAWSRPWAETARGGDFLLLLWVAGIAASALLLYPSGSVRYSLLLAPPLILLWLRELESKVAFSPYFLRNLVWLGVVLTALYSLPIAWGDTRFARLYPREARRLVADYEGPDRRVWFTGEWGFRYYMTQAGARLLPRTALGPEPGDVIVKPRVAFPWVTLYDGAAYSRLLEQRPTGEDFPVRLLDFESHAGFYSTAWGILPWSWAAPGRWEWFNVYEVLKEYDGPIPEPERHY